MSADGRHNPGRWVCKVTPRHCDGQFWLHGQPVPCRLAHRCLDPAARWTPYEYPLTVVHGMCLELVDPYWRQKHQVKLKQLKDTFLPEVHRLNWAKYSWVHREALAQKAREKRRTEAERRPKAPPTLPPMLCPSGGDCRNCMDDPERCPYQDADEDALIAEARREKLREQWRGKYLRQKAREATDPEYASRRREQDKARCARYYAKKKAEREKKNGNT